MKLFIIFISITNILFSQSGATINYLNEEAPDTEAKLFGNGTISSNEVEHSSPSFTSDGRKVVWNIMKLPSYKIQLREMNYENGRWSQPALPSFCDTISDYSFPSFSVDGKTLYFSSNRRIDHTDTLAKSNRLWCVYVVDGKWSTPRLVKGMTSFDGVYASSIAENGNIYFTHGVFQSRDWNIIQRKGKEFTSMTINTTDYDDGPFIHPNEDYIIFESDRKGSIDNSIDLYISFRNGISWSEPVNMGLKINTAFSERFAKLSPDGKYLFFGSTRNGQFDIFWIDASIIQELKSKAVNTR